RIPAGLAPGRQRLPPHRRPGRAHGAGAGGARHDLRRAMRRPAANALGGRRRRPGVPVAVDLDRRRAADWSALGPSLDRGEWRLLSLPTWGGGGRGEGSAGRKRSAPTPSAAAVANGAPERAIARGRASLLA